MSGGFFLIAIILLLIGHYFKVKRWALSIEVYEKPSLSNLYKAISLGQLVNLVLPFRLGDIVRIVISGKILKNGYTYAISTTFLDLYMDTIMVSLIVLVMYISGVEIGPMAIRYGCILVLLLIGTVFALRARSLIKKLIYQFSAIFNNEIRLNVMYFFWGFISAFKDILFQIKKSDLFVDTIGMWGSYLASYFLLSRFLKMSFQEVFVMLFGGFKISFKAITNISILIYMAVPLIVIYLASIKMKEEVKNSEGGRFLLPQIKDRDRLLFLQAYFSNENSNKINSYLEINKNTFIVDDLTSGSNAVTLLCLNNNQYYFKKYALFEDGEKLKEQFDWINAHQNLKIAKIIGQQSENNYFSYDMEYHADAVGLFKKVHSTEFEKTTELVRMIFDELEETLYKMNVRRSNRNDIEKYIDSKVISNLNKMAKGNSDIKDLIKFDKLIINNIEYDNFPLLKQYLSKEHLLEVFKEDEYCDIHGDLTIENVICTKEDYYLIDPNTGNIHESKFLDYAKFLQSIHGNYEFFMKTQYVFVDKNHVDYFDSVTSTYVNLFGWYKSYLESKFTKQQCRSIFYHEVIHWLRLLPYKINKDTERAALFYAGFIKVFNDVVNWYEK